MQRSIQRDLSIRIGLVILVIGIIVGGAYYVYSSYYQEREFKNYIEHQTKQISDTFTLQLWLFDLNTTRELCKMFTGSPEVSGLRLLDHNKKVIFEKDTSLKDGAVHISKELFHEGEKLVGYVDIYYSNSAWQLHLGNDLFFGILMILGATFGAFILINILLRRYLSRPLEDLQKDMATLSRGDFRQSDIAGQKTEIQAIIDAFNELAIKLQERDDELKNIDKKLRQSEKRYRSLTDDVLDTSAVGIFILDSDFRVVWVNQAQEEYFGFKRNEIIGKDKRQLINEKIEHIFENPDEFENKVFTTYDDNTYVERFECHILPDDEREERWLEHRSQPIQSGLYAGGRIEHYYDITERKQMEEGLLKVRKLESVGVLAGGIAHDFNNILAAILGNISLALTTVDPKDEIYELLEESEKASLRAKGLTQQLLTFTKGGEPVKKIAAINEVVRDSANFVLRGSNVRCNCVFSKNLSPVEIDPGQISQVIQNIVLNASLAMPTGGIIEIDCINYLCGAGDEILVKPGNYIKIAIKDNGVGIPKDLLGNIFDPYFTTKQKGSGLGLAITHSIISKHGGYITVDSELGQGTTFTIYLSVSQGRPEPKQKDVIVPTETAHGRIMIMDDEEMIRNLVHKMLSRRGFEVVSVEDGEKAIQLYQEATENGRPIDLIIMDLTIPGGMGGKEAIKEIHKIDPEAKVIVSSGYSNDSVMANFGEYGFCGAMVKPFQIRELMEIVGKAVSS